MNQQLQSVLREAGISFAGLARRVNAIGAEAGQALRYDYTAVGRWVNKGQVPRQPVPTYVAQALTERLGRRISPANIGMPGGDATPVDALTYPEEADDAFRAIIALSVEELQGMGAVSAPYVAEAFGTPSRDWLLSMLDMPDRSGGKISLTQVAGIRSMFALFQEMDVMRGGGHGRRALVEYMRSYVAPLLPESHTQEVRRALFQAAAEQSYLVGAMAYDDGSHGLAQRYLIQALRLAQEAGDKNLGAHVLAGMSDQANLLGYPAEAAKLARAGRAGDPDSQVCRANLLLLEARSLAAYGDGKAATQLLARAETEFAGVNPEDEPEWARFMDAAYMFGESAIAFADAGDYDATEEFADRALVECARQGRARRACLTTTATAKAYLARGDIEAATAEAEKVLTYASGIDSSRSRMAVRDIDAMLIAHPEMPVIRSFHERAVASGIVFP